MLTEELQGISMKRSTEARLLYVFGVLFCCAAVIFFVLDASPVVRFSLTFIGLALTLRLAYIRQRRRKDQLALKNELIEELYKLRN